MLIHTIQSLPAYQGSAQPPGYQENCENIRYQLLIMSTISEPGPCQTGGGSLLLWLILSRNPLTSQWSSIVHSHMIWLPLFLITINSTEKKFLWPWLLCGISNPTIQTWLPRNFNIFCSSNPRLLPTDTRPEDIENPYKMLPPEESVDMFSL